MTTHLVEDVRDKLDHADGLYHRLVLVVGPPSAGKTQALREIAKCTGEPLVNVNLELSRYLLDLAERMRPRCVQRLLERIVTETERNIVLLDNIEILFDVKLQQDPFRLLQGLSRHRTVAAAWNGLIEDSHICYAAPGHPEHRRYSLDGVLVASAGAVVT